MHLSAPSWLSGQRDDVAGGGTRPLEYQNPKRRYAQPKYRIKARTVRRRIVFISVTKVVEASVSDRTNGGPDSEYGSSQNSTLAGGVGCALIQRSLSFVT